MNIFRKATTFDDPTFFYKVGDVSTNKPWSRPQYSRMVNYFNYLNDNYYDLIKDYEIYIIGNTIWNIRTTWDVDLCVKGDYFLEDKIKLVFDTMNDIALNKFNLLLDLSFVNNDVFDDVIDYKLFVENNEEFYSKLEYKSTDVYKIGNMEKSINGVNNKISISKTYFFKTNWSNKPLPGSIVSKINNFKNPVRIKLNVSDLLSMSETDFINFNI
jgi:hypothetical protein